MPALRPYQREPLRAIVRSVLAGDGHTFTIMMSRQAGKNELSAQLQVTLLTLFARRGGDAIKASPTFAPQTLNSMERLQARLADAGYGGFWAVEHGRSVRVGKARWRFFSASPRAQVVGATANLLLEIDEAQDVDPDKYQRDFRPMGSTANVTTVLYGTPWDDRTLLEVTKQQNLDLERSDGIRRHFEYDWQTVAQWNPAYRRFVEAERDRLGADHPIFRTQYGLKTIDGEGRAFPVALRAALEGGYPRQETAKTSGVYVAGIDLAGAAEDGQDAVLRARSPKRDSTVVTIAEVVPGQRGMPPSVRVVLLARRTGVPHPDLFGWLTALLRGAWHCRRVVVDATGVGAGVAGFLQQALGAVVEPFVFTSASKSALSFQLLAALQGGWLSIYSGDDEDARTLRSELALARLHTRPNSQIAIDVDPAEGHDDYLMSLALTVRAAESVRPRSAVGRAG